jgi:hypothetical protein
MAGLVACRPEGLEAERAFRPPAFQSGKSSPTMAVPFVHRCTPVPAAVVCPD